MNAREHLATADVPARGRISSRGIEDDTASINDRIGYGKRVLSDVSVAPYHKRHWAQQVGLGTPNKPNLRLHHITPVKVAAVRAAGFSELFFRMRRLHGKGETIGNPTGPVLQKITPVCGRLLHTKYEVNWGQTKDALRRHAPVGACSNTR